MLLNIKLVKSTSMFCRESSAASVATWLNRNYEMMFCKMWGFDFSPPENDGQTIGQRISARINANDGHQLLEEYHGLYLKTESIEEPDHLIKKIIEKLDMKIPVDLSLYSVFYMLVIGYDTDKLYFIDVHKNSRDIHTIEFDKLLNYKKDSMGKPYIMNSFHVSGNEKKKIVYNDFVGIFKTIENCNENTINSIRMLADTINKKLDLRSETIGHKNPFLIPILFNIMQLARTRKLISSSLDYIYKLSNDQSAYDASNQFMIVGNEWNIVWNTLNKALYIPDKISILKRRISDRILKIADLEEQLINKIFNNHNDNRKYSIKRDVLKKNWNEDDIIFVDIKNCLNNKALALNEFNDEGASFTGQADFIVAPDLYNDKTIKADNMKFKITVTNDFDNIECSGQVLKIRKGIYKRIMFLGCSVWGNLSGLFKVEYEDGYCEESLLSMPDFVQKNIIDVTIASRIYYYWKDEPKQERFLFATSFIIDYESNITKIRLPETGNMHIFAISLS